MSYALVEVPAPGLSRWLRCPREARASKPRNPGPSALVEVPARSAGLETRTLGPLRREPRTWRASKRANPRRPATAPFEAPAPPAPPHLNPDPPSGVGFWVVGGGGGGWLVVGVVVLPVCPAFPLWVPWLGLGWRGGQVVAGVGGALAVCQRRFQFGVQGQRVGRCKMIRRPVVAMRAGMLMMRVRTVAQRAMGMAAATAVARAMLNAMAAQEAQAALAA